MSKQIGRAWVFGNDVDTDLIYHNKYLARLIPSRCRSMPLNIIPVWNTSPRK